MNRQSATLLDCGFRPPWWCWACPSWWRLLARCCAGTALHEPHQRKHLNAAARLVAAATVASHMGGSGAAGGAAGRHPAQADSTPPWAWPRQAGHASSLLTMLMFVLVSTVAAQADWSGPVVGVVLA